MFTIGVVLGIVATGALLYFVPAVDHGRERSIISVQPNGGNREVFHVNLPVDRVFAGQSNAAAAFPDGVEWPQSLASTDAGLEVFKLRDAEERVVGVASRLVVNDSPAALEWVLHLPARGSQYLLIDANEDASGARVGRFRAGTREFADRRGTAVERYIVEEGADAGVARLELATTLIGTQQPEEEATDVLAMAGDGS